MSKTILYLRTDLVYQDFSSGGSVGHTLGVIKGFIDNGFEVVCITTCLSSLIKQFPIQAIQLVGKPPLLKYTRWPIGCFLQSWMIIRVAFRIFKNQSIKALYQRNSILNFSGLFLSWYYKKKLILEYNGSDVWMARNWNKEHCWRIFLPIINFFELLNLRNADAIIVVSKALQEELINRGIKKEKILVNPNGVDVVMFDPEFTFIKNVACVKQL